MCSIIYIGDDIYMGVINCLKDVVSILQKSNDIEMVQKVIDIQQRIIEMEDTILTLKEENRKLKNNLDIEKKIKRFPNDTVIVIKNEENIMYCSKCWDDEKKLIQVTKDEEYYKCPKCNNHNMFYEKTKYYEQLNRNSLEEQNII